MTIKVECPDCDRVYRLSDEFTGKKLKCKSCGASIFVPDDEDDDIDVTDDVDDDEPPVSRRPRTANKKSLKPNRKKSRQESTFWSSPLVWIGLVGLGLFGMFVVMIAVAAVRIGQIQTARPSPAAQAPLPVAQVPIPVFPELGTPRILQPSGVRMWFVQFAAGNGPGQTMALRLYLPPTDAAIHSIPCVLVAPAGTNLLVGNDMDADDYHDETLPYAEAGMAVVFYSLDGGLADMQSATDSQIAGAYQKFRAAQAGVVNGRNALEFVLAKVPQVNPQRIYTAGHSSAGTVSLLMASHEPRLAGAIAYAPCSDVEDRLSDAANSWATQLLLPDLKTFLKQSSPKTHVSRVTCPVFLFHASDDSNVMLAESQAHLNLLKAAGKSAELSTVPTGDHYDSMVQQGIPLAIQWMNQRNNTAAEVKD